MSEKLTTKELDEVLKNHLKWLCHDGGERANLTGANLREVDLTGANLIEAFLRGADFTEANLTEANLTEADLIGADLRGASLIKTNLRRANLTEANLTEADLTGASLLRTNLRGANLTEANLRGASLIKTHLRDADLSNAHLSGYNIPQEGDLIVWKAGQEGLIKLCIPNGAKRTGSIIGRKCRAAYAKVLWTSTGKTIHGKYKNNKFKYPPDEMVIPDSYDDDPRIECTHGIHFFLTKEEAEEWL